ncbi:hypothetical protein GCM10027589_06320 [Actinocorallia lasiicapitis]
MFVMATDDREQVEARTEALGMLGMALDGEGFETRLVRPTGADPFLRVVSRQAGALAENVGCRSDTAGRLIFTYSWGDPICPATDPLGAVARLVHVLAPQGRPEAAVSAEGLRGPSGVDAGGADGRKAALEALAALLAEQGYVVRVGEFHLVASDRVGEGARLVEVWCQSRPDRGGGLCFTWAGGGLVCEADRPTDALVAVKTALLPRPR